MFEFSWSRLVVTAVAVPFLLLGLNGSQVRAEDDPYNVPVETIRKGGEAACASGKTFTIAYSHSVSEAAIVKQVRHFADERAKKLGCVKILHDNTRANNLEQQINAVQGWVTLGVDAIVVTPIEPSALEPLRKQAKAKGIKWLTYLGTMKDSDGYVGFDHAQSGRLIGEAAIAWVKEKGIKSPKALVTTLSGLPSLTPRWTEVERLFKENGIEIVTEQDAGDQTTGLRLAETALKQHPDLSIIIGMNDDAAVGAYRAAKAEKIDPGKMFIGGQDGSFEGLAATNEGGAYKGSSAILINELGANVVDLALNAVTGKGPSFAYTPTVWASKADQAQLDRLLANFKK